MSTQLNKLLVFDLEVFGIGNAVSCAAGFHPVSKFCLRDGIVI